MTHSEVDVDFAVYSRFAKSNYWLKNAFAQADIPSGEPFFIELPRDFNSGGEKYEVVLRLKKILYGQDKAAYLWYKILINGLVDFVFVTIKVDPCLFMFKAVICVVYADACLFWAHLKYNIDNVMKSFNEYRSSYNWEQSKGESVSEFLCIYIKTLVYGGFKFFPTGLILKVLEATGMYYCNGLPTPTKV